MNAPPVDAFVRALLTGNDQSPEDWREYFRNFHARGENPGREQLLRLHDAHGRTTYQALTSAVPATAEHVLDLGCGEGSLAPALRAVAPEARYTGIDICEPAIQRAKAQFGHAQTSFVTADAVALPFEDAAFDVVVSHLALMLVEPLESALAELRRVIKPGGTAVLLIEDRGNIQKRRFAGVAAAFLRDRYPAMAPPVTNPRVRGMPTLLESMQAAGLGGLRHEASTFSAMLAPEAIADLLMSFYIYGSLDAEQSAELRSILVEVARASSDAAGRARFILPLSQFHGVT